jgi:hypothetical protein
MEDDMGYGVSWPLGGDDGENVGEWNSKEREMKRGGGFAPCSRIWNHEKRDFFV